MSSPRNQIRLSTEIDHISNLPDTILSHILSNLPTKTVVKTCILSKRWRYLWSAVPALDFTEMPTNTCFFSLSSEQEVNFKSFVDKVLLHNVVSYVQRFCLNLYKFEPFYVNSWVIAAAKRQIHELNLNLSWSSDFHYFLPPWILWGEKLVILKLAGDLVINASMCGHFPSLEIINLKRLTFSDNEFLKRLSSSCPVLRELHIVECKGITTTILIESTMLITLEIKQDNVVLVGGCFVIKTPNLRYLGLHGPVSMFSIGEVSLLIDADLHSEFNNSNRSKKLLNKVCGVNVLRISSYTILNELTVPVFRNLTCFELPAADENMGLLLRRAPKLKTLIIFEVSTNYCNYFMCITSIVIVFVFETVDVIYKFNWDYPFYPKFAPELLPCLESISIGDFHGDKAEIKILAYFLKAAPALKEMNIILSSYRDISKVAILKKLLRLRRSSPFCQVEVIGSAKLKKCSSSTLPLAP